MSVPRILFVVGSIRRTARKSDLHLQPCTARNTAFLRRPPMGVSIGIEGSTEDTATLGGYVYIDGIPHILTVHHLFTNCDTGEAFKPGTVITQPSLQEVKEWGVLWDRLRSSGECFHLECVQKAFEDLKACLPEFPFAQLESSSGYRNWPWITRESALTSLPVKIIFVKIYLPRRLEALFLLLGGPVVNKTAP
jgi:hypothetical protein